MPRVPRSIIVAVEVAIALVIAWFAWRAINAQWAEVSRIATGVRPDWLRIAAATLIVLATYLMLVEVWRRMVLAWGEQLRFNDAARIWFISSLARYIPGKLWQVGAMGIMAQRTGVSPVAASGSALLATLANLLAGAVVLLVVASGALRERFGTPALVALMVLTPALIGSLVLLPRTARWAGALMGRDIQIPAVPQKALWLAFVGSIASWLLYGLAFQLLTAAVLGTTTGTVQDYIAVYTASYLVGFLVLFAPGGVGFREMTMIPLMQSLGLATAPQALVVAVTSRLWLTIVELGPGLLMLAAARRDAAATPNATDAN
jgi:uncharacterized membrane protein YbhN (UPF0104 family)